MYFSEIYFPKVIELVTQMMRAIQIPQLPPAESTQILTFNIRTNVLHIPHTQQRSSHFKYSKQKGANLN
jgi:hypothetical protein